MMSAKIRSFEDLDVWKESVRLAKRLCQLVKDSKCYSFRDQIQRAAISIPSNIAEGFKRNYSKDYIRFLFIAKGSAGELRMQHYLAIEIGMVEKDIGHELIDHSRKISAMLSKLIQSFQRRVEKRES
jgi:four helix bundle protein